MNLNEFQASPEAFRRWLRIEQADGKIAPLGDCVAPHQQECFRAADPALLKLVNPASPDPPHTRFWWERCRGASKTQDAVVACLWLLFAARRPLHGVTVACDQEQAAIARETIERLLRLNPELNKVIEIQRWQITNPHTTSSLKILAADERSSYGLLLDFALADELPLWPDNGMWVSITSTLGKRPNTLLVCCGNAGWKTSWCWPIREMVRSDPAWHFHAMASPPAWISAAQIAEQRKLLPALAFQRLWCGEWVDSTGDALPCNLIEKAFDAAASPMKGTEPGYCFVAGVDLSVSRDYSAAVILASPLATNPDQRIRLADAKQWIPPPGGKIDLLAVQRYLLEADERFDLEAICVDPFQSEHLAQTLELTSGHRRRSERRRLWNRPWVQVMPATPANLRQQASLTIQYFTDGRFRFYNHEALKADLLALRAVEMSYGLKLTTLRTSSGGHGDLAASLMVCLPVLHELASKKPAAIRIMDEPSPSPGQSPWAMEVERLRSENRLREAESRYIAEREKQEVMQPDELRETLVAAGRLLPPTDPLFVLFCQEANLKPPPL